MELAASYSEMEMIAVLGHESAGKSEKKEDEQDEMLDHQVCEWSD